MGAATFLWGTMTFAMLFVCPPAAILTGVLFIACLVKGA